jgi:hypothetical protein
VTATAARRKSGRKLVTGVQVLAFPNGGDPPKGRSGPGLRPFALCPPKLRGQCGMNKMGCLTRLRFAAISERSWRTQNASLSFPAALFRSSKELAGSFSLTFHLRKRTERRPAVRQRGYWWRSGSTTRSLARRSRFSP